MAKCYFNLNPLLKIKHLENIFVPTAFGGIKLSLLKFLTWIMLEGKEYVNYIS